MRIHTYEKVWLALSLLLIVGFISTVAYGAVGAGVTMVGDQGETVAPDDLDDSERFSEPRVVRTNDGVEAYVVAQQFVFQPGEIVLPANSRVTLYITSADVIHGFEVVGTNLNTMVIPGQIAELTFDTGEPAEYGVVCHEYCGSGHHDMEALLRVVPQDEFQPADDRTTGNASDVSIRDEPPARGSEVND
jgi:cytochrome c oxidase subunit 2